MEVAGIKPLRWIASRRKDLSAMPDQVKDVFGYALLQAQIGRKPDAAKPLKGFGSAAVLEVVEDWRGDTSRRVHGQVHARGLRPALFPEEVREGLRNPEAGYGTHPRTVESG